MQKDRPQTRRVNIRPCDIEIYVGPWLNNEFIITFIEWRNGQEIRYRVHMDFFWLGILAEKLHDVIAQSRKILDNALGYLRG